MVARAGTLKRDRLEIFGVMAAVPTSAILPIQLAGAGPALHLRSQSYYVDMLLTQVSPLSVQCYTRSCCAAPAL